MATLGTFLSQNELLSYNYNFKEIQLVQTETYNEFELKETIDKLDKKILTAIAIQLAIVGYGNKSYGSVIVDDKIIEIESFFKKNHIKSDLTINSKLKPGDLTPRRLIRFFRYSINEYMDINTNAQTYLFKKYCLNKNDLNRRFIFPGFEHMASPDSDNYAISELIKTYEYLDSRLNTKITDRIKRVLIARGFNLDKLSLQ